jgi:hypothetical protein
MRSLSLAVLGAALVAVAVVGCDSGGGTSPSGPKITSSQPKENQPTSPGIPKPPD